MGLVIPENSIRPDSRGKTESAHHVVRLCVPKTSSRDNFSFERQKSLFLRQNSLLRRNNSLFHCVGNLAPSLRNHWASEPYETGSAPEFEKFPVLFPVSSEFRSGDGFDHDCVRHHAVPDN